MTGTKRIEMTSSGKKTEIWIQDLEEFDWKKADYLKWVSSKLLEKAKRLKSEAAKRATIGSEYLLNRVCYEKKKEGKLPKEMEEWSFPLSYNKNMWGAPYFPGNPIYFNWSHSGQYVALAVSECPVGIDIQQRKKYKLSVAQKYFPEEIYRKLKEEKGERQEILFFRYWTLLEAWLKARGTGFHEFLTPDISMAFSEREGLQTEGVLRENQMGKGADWNYSFYQKIEKYEICLVEKS